MFPNIPGTYGTDFEGRSVVENRLTRLTCLRDNSAFWGQSFVAELTRISAQGERKLKLRRASLIKQPTQPAIAEAKEAEADLSKKSTEEDNEATPEKELTNVESRSQTI